MDKNMPLRTVPDVSAEERSIQRLVKQLRKLRWVGLNAEAERLERRMLARLGAPVRLPDRMMRVH